MFCRRGGPRRWWGGAGAQKLSGCAAATGAGTAKSNPCDIDVTYGWFKQIMQRREVEKEKTQIITLLVRFEGGPNTPAMAMA